MKNTQLFVSLLIGFGMCLTAIADEPVEGQFTANFTFDHRDVLVPRGGNSYLSLDPGAFLRMEGEDDGQPSAIEITVLQATEQVRFSAEGGQLTVKTRIVEEREWINGALAQVSRQFLARCPSTGNIFMFGKDVTQYEDGEVSGHVGSWRAGENGAQPGLMMPGFFLIGSRYQLEQAPGVSMDCAENVSLGVTCETPAGVFNDCIVVRETTPLEPDEEILKIYAPGVGLIVDGGIRLVAHHH